MRRIRKSFSRRITPLFPTMVVQLQLGKGLAMPTDPHHTPIILQSSTSQPQKVRKPRKPKRKNTHVPQPSCSTEHVVDEAIHKELGDSLLRAATTTSSLEVKQDSGNINRTQSKATPNESSSQRTDLDGGPRCQEAMRDTIAQTRFENVFKYSNDLLLAKAKIDVDHQLAERLQAKEQQELTDKEKATLFILFLEKRRKLFAAKRVEEKRNKPPTQAQKRKIMCTYLKNIEGYTLEQLKELEFDKFQEMFDKAFKRDDLEDVYKLVKAKYESTRPVKDLDLLLEGDLKTMFEPHVEDVVWRKQQGYKVLEWKLYESCGIHSLRIQSMQERIVGIKRLLEAVGITTAHVLVNIAQLEESAQKEQEVNSALIEEWIDIQAKFDAGYQLAQRLQAKEQQELIDAEKATLFMQFLEKRRKFFTAKAVNTVSTKLMLLRSYTARTKKDLIYFGKYCKLSRTIWCKKGGPRA
nr:hypothetical protein [Tanacetum cinerariifolium]